MRYTVRILIVIAVLSCAACASYVTPGGAFHLDEADHADIVDGSPRQPAPQFPASIALARVQAPRYKSYSSAGIGEGRFSVVATAGETGAQPLQQVSAWPSVARATFLSDDLLPPNLDSLEDLRLAAAKTQADVLLVYTFETSFQVQGRAYEPGSAIALGSPGDAQVSSTATAVFIDVRTGYRYGRAEASASLADVLGSADAVDRKRLEVEQEAFTQLLSNAEKTWAGIVQQYQ